MQLFLGAVPITLRLFSKARGYLLFSNDSRNNWPKPKIQDTSCGPDGVHNIEVSLLSVI